jgi:SAM-dependent methyltransferase
MSAASQNKHAEVSSKNANFWDELCGTQLAKQLGVNDNSRASLKRFDDWYMEFYPYLYDHIPFGNMRDKDVLEVGLGYGTVSQKIAEAGARYRGLDIAAGPVAMANHRLSAIGLPPHALQGSILAAPLEDSSFDYIVAIGCLHHTGNLQQAINECYRLLRPGGQLSFMVYYSYSWRRWRQSRSETLQYMARELRGYRGVVGLSNEGARAAYDVNDKGEGAPHTDWISQRSLRQYCRGFSAFRSKIENIDAMRPNLSRERLMAVGATRVVGLDLYANATK